MKAIMYHYVRKPDPDLPFFRFLHSNDFSLQLNWLSENFGVVNKNDWDSIVAGDIKPEESQGVVLTFDDGLKDHVRQVFPRLKKFNTWGMFYISAGPYLTGRVLDVHKVHLILGRLGDDAFAALQKILQPEMLSDEGRDAFDKGAYATQTNSKPVEQFKRYLNYYISYEWRESVLDMLMKNIFGCDDIDIIKKIYLSIEDIRELHRNGMVMGGHSVTHRVLSRLSVKEQRIEVFKSQEFLHDVLGVEPTTFCYPYGGSHSFTNDTQDLLQEAGVKIAFSVEPRDCTVTDFNSHPLALPRYDCNMYPNGQLYIESNAQQIGT